MHKRDQIHFLKCLVSTKSSTSSLLQEEWRSLHVFGYGRCHFLTERGCLVCYHEYAQTSCNRLYLHNKQGTCHARNIRGIICPLAQRCIQNPRPKTVRSR